MQSMYDVMNIQLLQYQKSAMTTTYNNCTKKELHSVLFLVR